MAALAMLCALNDQRVTTLVNLIDLEAR